MKVAILALAVTALCGCGMGRDPVAELKSAMGSFEKHSSATDYNFDVSKTDSLVSPFLGTVKYTYAAEHNDNPDKRLPDHEMTASFAYQEKKWVLKRLCEKLNYHIDSNGKDAEFKEVFGNLSWCDDDDSSKPGSTYITRDLNQWDTSLVISR